MNGLCKGFTVSGGAAHGGRARLVGLAIFFALIILPLQAQDMSEQELQNMYMSYLWGEGYSPWVDEDGDVAFEDDDLTFYIIVNEDDLGYFRLMFPGFYNIDTQQERQRAADAISKVNREKKVAKVYMNTQETRVNVDAQVYVRNPGDFKGIFRRMFNNVVSAAYDFIEAVED
jgi:hypothetical protein